MSQLNLPWTESPYFNELLEQLQLSTEDQDLARKYHEDGFIILRNFLSEDLLNELNKELLSKYDTYYNAQQGRTLDLWKNSAAIKDLATHPEILKILQMLYGREAIPFQTLNFKFGSRQKAHSDSIHFQSLPQRFMCGVWAALEDTDESNGTLMYYPGSHRWPLYDYSVLSKQLRPTNEVTETHFYAHTYEPFVEKLITQAGAKPEILRARKGDVIIWSANLVHGGLPHPEEGRTRWSQVTHYFFEDCLYYNPLQSNSTTGEWCLVPVVNIRNGKRTRGNYNGRKVRFKKADGARFLISPYAIPDWRDAGYFFKRVFYKLFR